jgi:hypothetical protein
MTAWDPARVRLLPGFLAGVAFLVTAMLGGALNTTPWAMPDAISAAIGLTVHGYAFQAVPVTTGIAVHLTVSTLLGALYSEITHRLRLRGVRLVVGAVLFSGLETPVSIWLVLHSILSAPTFHFFLATLPLWASICGRNLYGLVLGLALAAAVRNTRDR